MKINGYPSICHMHHTIHSHRNIRNAEGTEVGEQRSLHKDATGNLVVKREVRNPHRKERGENAEHFQPLRM